MSLSSNYGSARYADDYSPLLSGLSVLGRLSYRLDSGANLALAYDASKQRTTARGTAFTGNGVGDWSTGVELTRAPGEDGNAANAVEASVGYVGNRFQLNTTHSRDFSRPSDMHHVHHSATMGTALAFADDKVAIGRPVRGAYALIDKHPALEGSDLRVAPSENGDAAKSDGLGPVIVSEIAPYAQSRIAYDVEDLPEGYDIGNGAYDFVAPYKAGHALTVGSGATVMVLGDLRDTAGKPLKLISGVAYERQRPDEKITLFTNAAGRFSAQGFGPGDWQIEMSSPDALRYAFSIAKGAAGMMDVGTLNPVR
jgi:outer membrane usher protein